LRSILQLLEKQYR